MITANLYIRVSTDEQAEKGYSQRNQEEVLRKYCEIKSIQVGKVFYEDHSAKTFQRPSWNSLLVDLRRRKGQTDLVLFTKWDRFSRNVGDAYHMIGLLRKWGVEPQAIEQPLDMEIPESKIMLAFYLAAPEVENDRRGLNIFWGLRRARKEGRWINTAPLGYANLCHENGKKYIAPVEPAASLIKQAFEELAKGDYSAAQIHQQLAERGLATKLTNFYDLIRNPVYCGKIVVPKYKEEEEHWVPGLHKPLISESLFHQVQDVLNGRSREKPAVKISSDELLPLRGFLQCPRCTRLLTGSASKGRKHYYSYYHCSSSCGIRFKADQVNASFKLELEQYFPREDCSEYYVELLVKAFKDNGSDELDERKKVLGEIAALGKKLSDARELLLSGSFTEGDFRAVKLECEKRIAVLESRLPELSKVAVNIRGDLVKAVSKMQLIESQFSNGEMWRKRAIIGSIFPENLCFDGEGHRTARVNDIAWNIGLINSELRSKKKREELGFSSLPASVVWAGIEPATHGFSVHCSTD